MTNDSSTQHNVIEVRDNLLKSVEEVKDKLKKNEANKN